MGGLVAVFGAFFALVGLSEPQDTGALATMVLVGAVFIGFGLAMAFACVAASETGLRYRYGVIRRTWSSADIAAVVVGAGSGAGYSRVAMHVVNKDGKRKVLTALQRPDTAQGRALVEQQARAVRNALAR